MKLEVLNHHTERRYVLEGNLDDIKNQLLQHWPWLQEPLQHMDLHQIVRYINSQQLFSAALELDDEEREMLPVNKPQEAPMDFWDDAANVDDSNALENEIDGIEPLPEGLSEMWVED